MAYSLCHGTGCRFEREQWVAGERGLVEIESESWITCEEEDEWREGGFTETHTHARTKRI